MPVFIPKDIPPTRMNKSINGSSVGQLEDLKHRPMDFLTRHGRPEEHI